MKTKILIGLCAVLVLGGGTVALAGKALPGDLLYGMKLGVNERVEGFLAMGSTAQTDWHIEVAERRLIEAGQSALKGKFDTEAQTLVLANFNDHLKGVEEYLIALSAEGRTEEAKEVAVKVGQALARQVESLAYAQGEVKASTDTEAQGSLDFLFLRVASSLTAAANIALGTLVEDEAPVPEIDPSTVDEWGNPI